MSIVRRIIKNCIPYGISNHIVKKHEAEQYLREIEQRTPFPDEPLIYNGEGQLLKTMYLKDIHGWMAPYNFTQGMFPKYIFWDRHNYGLRNHFYSHRNVLTLIGKPVKRFAMFLESETIVPDDYNIFDSHKGLEKDFDAIFTMSSKLLDKFSNAVFVPAFGFQYGTEHEGGTVSNELYKNKTKNVSIIASNKSMCELHKFRANLAKYFLNDTKVDTYGTFNNGPRLEKIGQVFESYRYSIAIENDITPYYFTEKILNCFAAMTVPIYVGATHIGEFFNTDGIINVPSLDTDTFDKIVSACNEDDYLSRLPAILDNFNRVNDFTCTEDYMYKHYKEYFV